MGPSEDELRAALRDGEGEVPDSQRVIGDALELRGRRRTRLLGMAAAVVIVAGVGGVVAAISFGGDPADTVAGANDAPAYSRNSGANSDPAGPGTIPRCPSAFPLISGGVDSGSDQLFAKPVTAVVLCAYSSTSSARPRRLAFTGSNAMSLVDSLENAPKFRSRQPCPLYVPEEQTQLAFLGVTSSGTVLDTVTTALGPAPCNTQVTNGDGAVRYGWVPPSGLAARLLRVRTGPSARATVPTVPLPTTGTANPTSLPTTGTANPTSLPTPTGPHAHASPVH